VVIAPDCVNGGYTIYICTVCGDSYVTDETAALDHTYESEVTAPDCVNGGYTTYTCITCGDSYVTDETAALGHTYDNACDAACNTCGEVREVPEHVYDDDTDTDCNECGFAREVTIVILGDADGNGKVNNRDLGLLQLYLNDDDLSGKSFDAAACDMDGNGKLNNRDLGLLQRLLNG
jgi:DNA-directed RNA polymerase subunit RPC12/RpoP